jgi:ABC-type nickel/cobalt efflux system permease component RcnA
MFIAFIKYLAIVAFAVMFAGLVFLVFSAINLHLPATIVLMCSTLIPTFFGVFLSLLIERKQRQKRHQGQTRKRQNESHLEIETSPQASWETRTPRNRPKPASCQCETRNANEKRTRFKKTTTQHQDLKPK